MKYIVYLLAFIGFCTLAILSNSALRQLDFQNKMEEEHGFPKTTYGGHTYVHSDSCSYCIYNKAKEKEKTLNEYI